MTWVMADRAGPDGIALLRLHDVPSPGPLSDVRIGMAGLIRRKEYWIRNRFDFFAVSLVVEGRGTFQVDGGLVQPVERGSVFVEYPGPLFHYGPHRGSTWNEWTVAAVGPGVERLRQRGLLPCDGRVHRVKDERLLLPRYRRLTKLTTSADPADADRAALEFQGLLIDLHHAREDLARPVDLKGRIGEVLEYCAKHVGEELDFERIAADHAMSYSTLRQLIRKATGMPPAKFALTLRCDAAKALLADTDLTVKEISDKLGWPDPYTMSRAFRRVVGVSPAQYRERCIPWLR